MTQRRRRRPPTYPSSNCLIPNIWIVVMLLIFVIIFTQASFSRWISIGEQPTRRGGIRKSPKDDGIDAQGTRAGAVSTGREKVLSHIAHAYLHPELIVEGVYCKRKVVAFAVTLTKDGNHLDGAAVLATSIGVNLVRRSSFVNTMVLLLTFGSYLMFDFIDITCSVDRACGSSEFLCDLVAFLNDEVGVQSEAVLKSLGYRTLRPGLPVNLDDIKDEMTRNRVAKGGCCGPAEMIKFHAYKLTEYHRVVHLDTDALVLEPLDPILDANDSLLFTTDVNMANPHSPVLPVQGGFLVIRPNRTIFNDLVEVVKTTPFTGKGWGGSMIGLFWGGITVQGLLPYYYTHRAAPENTYRALDRCTYNNMVDTDECRIVDVQSVRSAHFTNCQKPWKCTNYPHPKHALCTKLLDEWFAVRRETEAMLGLEPSKACAGRRSDVYQPMLQLESR